MFYNIPTLYFYWILIYKYDGHLSITPCDFHKHENLIALFKI